ncbi:hypothetical protein [Helicobacter cetorum]|uniref:Uncharacterized protein n=1 Tax=Helicobacter cetorum (strain ATCC BAA-429 / MIT 00-7128) TaxID=182217 RepID=I0EMB9_HELC0|nr:hypothetical protein [Helicobacter cetorum]AFI04088.1 hypothetical protein HCW_04075 [Helicobacter cetorum MIT 00-7128]
MQDFLKKISKEYKTKLFLIYWLRWMLSAVVMLPFMQVFDYFNFPLWLNLFLGQTIGALIFFKLDKLIFSKKENSK